MVTHAVCLSAYEKRKELVAAVQGAVSYTHLLLIITHSTRILESLRVDRTHVMVDGRIVKSGDASLVEQINRTGFEPFLHEAAV